MAAFTQKCASSPSRSISLSLTTRYASSWKTWEGIRELVQNWHDGLFTCLENGERINQSQELVSSISSSRISFKHTYDSNGNVHLYTALSNPVHVRQGDIQMQQLGKILYCGSNGRLYLVNHTTALRRKILLLGFSQKANNKEVIGQFGEGLKIGALALIREGRSVTMETSKDRWSFGLNVDEVFNEEVLTVFVNQRHDSDECEMMNPEILDLSDDDTCVTVARLSEEEWAFFAKRFLFLSPPFDSVKCELGTLLLDERHKGQLHVKGVWVSDLTKDGLSSGVDFSQLRIDRDRRAVIHRSDIDHQVSGMWVRAIEHRPELINKYYQLLEDGNSADVKHASSYLSSSQALSLVANRFFELHGRNAYPISNSASFDKLMSVKNELQMKITLCNEPLVNILCNSGFFQPLNELLAKTNKQDTLIPLTSLTDEEIGILKHCQKLLQVVWANFNLGCISISNVKTTEVKVVHKKFYLVPRCLLDPEYVHKELFRNCENSKTCNCSVAFIGHSILMLGDLVSVANATSVDSGHHRSSVAIAQLIATLSAQVCGQASPFCLDLHTQSHSSRKNVDHQLCKEREQALMKQNENLYQELSDIRYQHATELKKFESEIMQLEKELVKEQVKFADVEQHLNDEWQKQLNKVEKKNVILEKDIVELKQEIAHLEGKLESSQAEVSQKTKAHSRQMKLLQDKCQAQQQHLAQRFHQLSLFIDNSDCDGSNEIKKLAAKLVAEVREMDQKDVCVVCVVEKPNCVLLPCRHHVTCTNCATRLSSCPYCRTHIRDRISTFE